ncbi:DUF5810 domain-containing protein [Salinibaculum salinum]|uniref:DUF5810 domain-containing protein n=1 Tax=Salinibaculum salinum TaxID=3131996 RepID=UPI0030EE43C2
MGYACPVCEDPQSDAIHLANHLAFTALVRGGDHEDWLDDRVPDWESMDEETLGEYLTVEADETDYPQVFEDTTGQGHDHADHEHAGGHDSGRATQDISDAMLADAERQLADEDLENPDDVLAEARELTRKRRAGADEESDSESE